MLLLCCSMPQNSETRPNQATDLRDDDYEYPDEEVASEWNGEYFVSDGREELSSSNVYVLGETVQKEGERASLRTRDSDAGANWQKVVRMSSYAGLLFFVFFIVCIYSGYLRLISRSVIKAVVVRYKTRLLHSRALSV